MGWTHHPHVHMIVPGGGIALDGTRWISSRPAFLLPVRVLGALFRRLFLTRLLALFDAGKLGFFGAQAHLAARTAFLRHLSPIRKKRWVVYAKPPFAGPQAVLAYLSRYTHRVAISNRRLIAFDETGVTFRYKYYRRDSAERQQVMTLAPDEFLPPPLPDPRAAAWLPPHSALRSARQFNAQGRHGARPQAARRRRANRGTRPRRTARPSSAMPMLWRAHDHHRDLCPLVPAPRAASASGPRPGEHAMIRHGSPCSMAAIKASRPMEICAPTSPVRSKLRLLHAGSGRHRGQISSDVLAILPMMGKLARLSQPTRSTPKPFYP